MSTTKTNRLPVDLRTEECLMKLLRKSHTEFFKDAKSQKMAAIILRQMAERSC